MFPDILISHKKDGKVKVQVYHKATHPDQYLNFSSLHSLNHKLGVIRTLYDHCDIVTEEADVTLEIVYVKYALGSCGYPSWSFKRVREQLDQQEMKNNLKINKKDSKDKSTKTRVTLPYVKVFQRP